ncbi:hypothetical protein BJY04DRAFT_180261 [Aspergillus karnatakaensis]|uniref:uncharacterized protein n=1 Tax=Aspergillus karnatakaensis TaxID=1810916 RepID=UPI003CCDA37C
MSKLLLITIAWVVKGESHAADTNPAGTITKNKPMGWAVVRVVDHTAFIALLTLVKRRGGRGGSGDGQEDREDGNKAHFE